MSTMTTDHCPSWCVPHDDFPGEHWCNPGSDTWPAVRATNWPQKDTPLLVAHPVWGEFDGLTPGVALWMTGESLDESIDMTPAEARTLAARLVAAAEAVEANR